MSVFLYAVKIIEGPSPSRFALATAEGGSEDVTLRLTLSEDGEIIHERWMTWINFNSVKYSTRLDGMYTVQDRCWNVQYDPLRRAGHIVANDGTYDSVAAARRAFFGARPRRFIAVRYATWL